MEVQHYTYTLMDELMASSTQPIPSRSRLHQLTVMHDGLANIEKADKPTTNDWRVVSDAVNLMETLVEMCVVEDNSGLLMDAVTALANAGRRHRGGGQIRLDGPGIQAVRAVLEDYAAVLEAIDHRTIVRCHRKTEKRLRDILAGRARPHDVEVMDL